MASIYGVLGVNDTDRVFVSTLGQQVVYDAITQLNAQYNAELAQAMSVFVERTTSDYKLRYKLPGTGRMQRTGVMAPTGAVKANGQWDVAFPLEGFGDQVATDRVDLAYMTVGDLDRHLSTVQTRNTNTVRYEVLKALLNSAARTFVDPLWGSLTVQPLANADSTNFPPVLGSETEATTHQHYAGTNYTGANISDTNNPLKTIRDNLEEHFGVPTAGAEIVVFCNAANVDKLTALTEFNMVIDRDIQPGANADRPFNIPSVPGRVLGRTDSGVWLSRWDWIPSGYLFGIHLGAPAPLIQRVDLAETGLAQGLTLVARDDNYPIQSSYWEHRFGFGVGNRLNGVAMQLVASTSYSTPTGY